MIGLIPAAVAWPMICACRYPEATGYPCRTDRSSSNLHSGVIASVLYIIKWTSQISSLQKNDRMDQRSRSVIRDRDIHQYTAMDILEWQSRSRTFTHTLHSHRSLHHRLHRLHHIHLRPKNSSRIPHFPHKPPSLFLRCNSPGHIEMLHKQDSPHTSPPSHSDSPHTVRIPAHTTASRRRCTTPLSAGPLSCPCALALQHA